MFELLIYMFENYLSSKSYLDFNNISMELEAAGFDNDDIEEAFDWFSQLKSMSDKIPKAINANENNNLRIFTEKEYKKISSEGLGFILFFLVRIRFWSSASGSSSASTPDSCRKRCTTSGVSLSPSATSR